MSRNLDYHNQLILRARLHLFFSDMILIAAAANPDHSYPIVVGLPGVDQILSHGWYDPRSVVRTLKSIYVIIDLGIQHV